MSYRVWWHDEFRDCKTDDERDDAAWPVPDRRSFFNPDLVTPCEDIEDAAEQYAEYFHNNRDGWENSWPIEFVVHDGRAFHLVSVDRDYDPTFSAAIKMEIT